MNLTQKKENWKTCDVNNLATNFHRYDKSSEQHDRLEMLYLEPYDVEALFTTTNEIESFAIHLALDKEAPQLDAFNFRPLISVKHKDTRKGVPVEKSFQPGPTPEDTVAAVPFIFKEWLTKNWMELDTNLIDDVFTASFGPEGSENKLQPVKRANKRLTSYYFSKELNPIFFEFIRTHQFNIKHFIFHLGIDMNKFNHKDQFTFSPVFEVHIHKQEDQNVTIHQHGIRSSPSNDPGTDIAYFEYSAPCPSTCPSEI
jgi:hypothetical protein